MTGTPLTYLKPGMFGIVETLQGEPSFQKRLADLGLVPGTKVRYVRKAPFGDPIEIEVRGYLLALRGKDAKNVLLKV